MPTFSFLNRESEQSPTVTPEQAVVAQPVQSLASLTPQAQSRTLATQSLSDRASSWRLVAEAPLATGLTLSENQAGGFDLTWTNPQPASDAPTVIVATVPPQLLEEMNGWRFKQVLVSRYRKSNAHQPCEPLTTPFFKSLMEQGYLVNHIEHASLSEATIDLRLSQRVSIVDSVIRGSMKLECDHLTLDGVHGTDCAIEFKVKDGTWNTFVVDGDKSQLQGDAGRTRIGDSCHFSKVLWRISLQNVTFDAPDFFAQLNGGTFEHGSLPPSYTAKLNTISDEEYQRRVANANVARRHVESREWEGVSDAS